MNTGLKSVVSRVIKCGILIYFIYEEPGNSKYF